MSRHCQSAKIRLFPLLLAAIAATWAGATTALAAAPSVLTGPNTPEPEGKVRLLGYVNPEGSPVGTCRFEYGQVAGVYEHEVACANHPGNEIQSLAITATAGTLKLGFDSETTSDLPFNASPAEVETALAALPAIGAEGVSVSLEAAVSGFRRYRIAFHGPLANSDVQALEASSGATPLTDGGATVVTQIPGGLSVPAEVTAELEGLSSGAAFHYRLFAENGDGPASSAEGIFEVAAEPSSAPCPNVGALGFNRLSECRAWEMTSRPDKRGGDVIPSSTRVRVAADGSAVAYQSLVPFGDTSGAGFASEYMAVRSSSGWATHGILPQQPPNTFDAIVSELKPRYDREFSADLDKGVVFAWRPLDEQDPNVNEVANLYLRDNLRTPGLGHYSLLTSCPYCAESTPDKPLSGTNLSAPGRPRFVEGDADFRHVLFLSRLKLLAEVQGGNEKLYEWDEGTLRLAGVLPNGKPASEPSVGYLGRDPAITTVISRDGSRVVFLDGQDGNLYLRTDGQQTVQLNIPEGGPGPASGGAALGDMSADGSRVFFTSNQGLTEGAPSGQPTLYTYDTTKPASDPSNLSYVGPVLPGGPTPGGAVLGTSADGSVAYFWSTVQLVPGGPPIAKGIFSWNRGEVDFVAPISGSDNYFSNESNYVRVSPEGQLLFSTTQAIGPTGQTHGPCSTMSGFCRTYYLYNPDADSLQCVSCGPDGSYDNAYAAHDVEIIPGQSAANNPYHISRPLTDDGRYAFFTSSAALVPEDTNGVDDAYVFDAVHSTVSLLSSGTDSSPSTFLDASADGTDAVFATRERLSGWDLDGSLDIYDARIDGGLPEPPPVAAPCEGEACRSASPNAPLPPAPASATFQGAGNPVSGRRRCRRGTRAVVRRGKTRCQRQRKRRPRRAGRGAKGGSR